MSRPTVVGLTVFATLDVVLIVVINLLWSNRWAWLAIVIALPAGLAVKRIGERRQGRSKSDATG